MRTPAPRQEAESEFYNFNLQESIIVNKRIIIECTLQQYRRQLVIEEKSPATIEKYCRDVAAFSKFVNKETVTKDLVLAWKQMLIDAGYAVRSINSMLASLNNFFDCSSFRFEISCS